MNNVEAWKVKTPIIKGKSYKVVNKVARRIFHEIERRTKRKPYIRSEYFEKQKIFLTFFWDHLSSKTNQDRLRRLKFFECGLELIQKTQYKPTVKLNPNNPKETFYRFLGVTNGNLFFDVQLKRDKDGNLELISIFPVK